MTVHLLGLPHTDVDSTWSTCAFTQKVRTLAAMLDAEGHDVTVYGSDIHDHAGDHVTVHDDTDRRRWFGDTDFRTTVMDRWDWHDFNQRCAAAIRDRWQPGDVVSLTMGLAHKAVADLLPGVRCAELGIGYEASFADFRVFESYAWLHHTYGRQGINDGRYYDTVIPNAFDPDDFTTGPDQGYVLYLGRMTERKGLEVVREVAKRHRVLTAGQGDARVDGAEHLGPIGPVERREVLAGATCLILPTSYIEPFGGVVVEAQMSGVPAITSDWGAFPELIDQGVSGFRCRRLDQYLAAIDAAQKLRGPELRDRAIGRWSLDAVAPLYTAYLEHLATLDGDGWYSTPSGYERVPEPRPTPARTSQAMRRPGEPAGQGLVG